MKLLEKWKLVLSPLYSLFFCKGSSVKNVDVQGSEEFRKKVCASLVLLQERAPEMFKMVNESLTFILEAKVIFLSVAPIGNTLTLSEDYVNQPEEWLAATIALEAARGDIYMKHRRKFKSMGRFPDEFYSTSRVLDVQYECLKQLGASYEDLKYLADKIEQDTKQNENTKDISHLKEVYVDFANLCISFEKFAHEVQSFIQFSKSETDNSRTAAINYVPGASPQFKVEVSTTTIVSVLERYLANKVSLKELENWASTLLMDDDHFAIADSEPQMRREPVLEALHEISSWPEAQTQQIIEGYIARIKENS